jgi:hypothetical protein
MISRVYRLLFALTFFASGSFAQDSLHVCRLGSIALGGTAYGVAVAGNYAYVADYRSGLRVINIANPAAPMQVGFYDTPGYPLGVAVAGCTAYVADHMYFGTYDISYFSPCPVPPRAPDSLVVNYIPETSRLYLKWSPVLFDTSGRSISVSRYTIFRSATLNGSQWDSIGSAAASSTPEFFDSTATNSRSFYRVKAVANN